MKVFRGVVVLAVAASVFCGGCAKEKDLMDVLKSEKYEVVYMQVNGADEVKIFRDKQSGKLFVYKREGGKTGIKEI